MAAENEKELQQLQKRMRELADKSYMHNVYTYTGFLSMAEQDVLYSMQTDIAGIGYELFGGNEECERQILRFGKEENLGYAEVFPISCILIEPLIHKFADELTHRDFLGAIMNLGIERSTVGDIFIQGKMAYIFCMDKMAAFIVENLDKIKHTNVKCKITDAAENLKVAEPVTEQYTVSSERADGVIAHIYKLSRNQSLLLFGEKKVFINGKLNENNSYILKNKDKVTVRGFGKFIYRGMNRETKKGKYSVSADIYR